MKTETEIVFKRNVFANSVTNEFPELKRYVFHERLFFAHDSRQETILIFNLVLFYHSIYLFVLLLFTLFSGLRWLRTCRSRILLTFINLAQLMIITVVWFEWHGIISCTLCDYSILSS